MITINRFDIRRYLRLYLVLETSALRIPLDEFIIQVVRGGVTAIQIRDKNVPANERFTTALKISKLLEGADVLFIINNNADIALAAGAHGVHVGVKDLPPEAVRSTFPCLVTGYSCNTTQDVLAAHNAGVDYVGIGPAFTTSTKTDHRAMLGPEGIRELACTLNIPSVAIGGINRSNVELLNGTGVHGIAVSQALCGSEHPLEEARTLRLLAENL